MRRRIHACHMRRRIHACHMRRRIHACHMRRRIHASLGRTFLRRLSWRLQEMKKGRVCVYMCMWQGVCVYVYVGFF
jgi:hypothetical protein